MTTQQIQYTVPSNSWTGTVTVTDANLNTDLSEKDFKVYYNDVQQGTVELTNWAKTTSTLLTYSGSSLNQNDVVKIQRATPLEAVRTVAPFEIIQASLWNSEIDRGIRRDEELQTFGGLTTFSGTISDGVYGASWDGVADVAPSKNAVYDKIELILGTTIPAVISDTAYASNWDAVTTIAPSKNAVYDAIEERKPFAQISGRLTLTSNTPVLSSNASGSTVYFTPFNGNQVYLYESSRWQYYPLTEISLAVGTMTNDLPYDIFLYSSGGTLTMEKVAWTNATTRATALVLQNGVYVKTGETNKRYIGTMLSPGSNTVYAGNYSISTNTLFHNTLYNHYNQVIYKTRSTYVVTGILTTTAWTLLGNAHQGKLVIGSEKGWASSTLIGQCSNSSGATRDYRIGIYDVTSTNVLSSYGGSTANTFAYVGSASVTNQYIGYFTLDPRYYSDVVTNSYSNFQFNQLIQC